eukprot:2521363-Amphidinium_carterae.2
MVDHYEPHQRTRFSRQLLSLLGWDFRGAEIEAQKWLKNGGKWKDSKGKNNKGRGKGANGENGGKGKTCCNKRGGLGHMAKQCPSRLSHNLSELSHDFLPKSLRPSFRVRGLSIPSEGTIHPFSVSHQC